MPYAQTAYKQFVGNSHLGLDEVGCFVDSDCNLLEKPPINIHVDPPTLNTFYTQKKLYSYDLTDRANDDITWSTVTKYCPRLVVSQIGSSGFPNSDLAIVQFRYQDHAGREITHFCAVNRAADHSIIDSWDGHVKLPNEYEHVYGPPIAWATFVYHSPEVTPPGPASAPISAPTAVITPSRPAPPPAPAAPKQIYLPPSVWIWHVYKPGGPYTLPYAIGALDPKRFNGLTYTILGNPVPHIYLIQTQNFGTVAIYAGPDTVAQFPGTGHGEGEDTSVPVSEVVPAPAPAPSIVYSRFSEPMPLVTNKDTHRINFDSGNIASDLAAGTPFEAVGKATLPNGDVYFMNDNDFGVADETQHTAIMVGVKTVDLNPAPDNVSATATGQAPYVTNTADTAAQPPKPINPTVSWQDTFEPIVKGDAKANPQPVDYSVIDDMVVYDFATGNDEREVPKLTRIPVVGTFIFAGRRYYLAESSFKYGTWYGFPVASLRRQDARTTPFNTNDDINQLDREIDIISKKKQAIIKAAGSADGLLSRFKLKRSV